MRKIRVLQFITPAGFYGAERWVIALANNCNHDSVVYDLAVTQEGPEQDLSVATYFPKDVGEVHYLPMKGRFDVRVIRHLIKIIRSRKIDVIHTHGYKSDILGLLAARITGIQCISTPHGFSGNVGFKLRTFIRLGTFALRYFDLVAPLSEDLMNDMQRFKVPTNKTRFIRNGVDLKEIDAALAICQASREPDSSLKDREQIIGFIGQIIPRKGIDDLLAMFDRLHVSHPFTRLQLLGDGSQRKELEAKAAALPSATAIEFLGFRSDRLDLLANFSVFVMTSSLEGIPRCMMEAMAVGVPVVAYDIPGVDALIEHNKTGLLAPYGDQNALLSCCQRILDDAELAQMLIVNAREKIDKLFSAARMAEEYEQLFRSLLAAQA